MAIQDKLAAIFGLGLTSAFGLFFYVLFFIAALRNKILKKNPYFQLSISQGIADCSTLFLQIFYAMPSSFADRLIYGDIGDHVTGFILAIAWYSSLATIAFLAINRYIAICKPNLSWFLKENNNKIFFTTWILGVAVSLPTATNCCRIQYCRYPKI